MKNILNRIPLKMTAKELAIGVLACLLALWLVGCDGTTEEPFEASSDAGTVPDTKAPPQDTKNSTTDTIPATGTVSCEIPASSLRPGLTPSFIRVTNDAKAECLSFKAANPTIPNSWPKANSPSTATSFSTSGVDCEDVAHDFQGTTGMPWCLGLIGDSVIAPCAGTPDGKVTCKVSGMAPMGLISSSDPARRLPIKSYAACNMAGKFVGWMCTTS